MVNRLKVLLVFVLLGAFASLPAVLLSAIAVAEEADHAFGNVRLPYQSRQPIYFIENRGQVAGAVKYYAGTGIQTVYMIQEGIVFDLVRAKPGRAPGKGMKRMHLERLVFTMGFEGANQTRAIRGLEKQKTTVNYFIGGDSSKWRTRIPTFKSIVYESIYPGIDLRVYGKGNALEYEFIVAPGADVSRVRLFYDGIDGLRVNREGRLVLETPFGELEEARPHIYQMIHGEKVAVESEFKIHDKTQVPLSAESGNVRKRFKMSYGFQIGPYDSLYPLIIDPTLIYCTFLGGSNKEYGWGIAVDGSGNAYVSGYTASTDFPVENAYEEDYGGGDWDAFITKFNSNGNTVAYSTYLGGSENDEGHAIAIDGSGNTYVTGHTESDNFPTTPGAYDTTHNGGPDVFVSKLSADGGTLSYSTYLGGSDETVHGDNGLRIAVDSLGCAYVTGRTFSTDFPTTTDVYQENKNNGTSTPDIFITKFNADGSDLSYSTYLGGSETDYGWGIAIDGSGNAHIAGFTDSDDFPTQNPYQSTNSGYQDAILVKLNTEGTDLVYSTYFGGTNNDGAYGLAIDTSGNAYIPGYTNSTDFPTESAYQANYGGGDWDGFVAKFNSDASDLTYSTYLGGNGHDWCRDIALNGSTPYVVGPTDSTNFPTENPYHGSNYGGFDVFITKFNTSGNTLAYSTYIGGENNDIGLRIAVDSSGNAFATGYASDDFPLVDPYQSTYGGGTYDAFVLKYYGESAALVDLLSFTATGLDDAVRLDWETASEIDTAGFHLWRSRTKGGDYIKITEMLIPAEGGATSGASYSHSDTDVSPPQVWYYKLEAIGNDGDSVFYGPVSGVVGDAAVKEVNGPTTIGEGDTAPGMGEIIIDGRGQHTVTTGSYPDNPAGTPAFTPTGDYWFVDVTNPAGLNSVTVRFCPAQSGNMVYYWDGDSWIPCSDQDYTNGCIAVKITNSTAPQLSDLTSLVFAMGRQSEPIPTLSQWGMIVLSLSLGTGAVLALRRRRLGILRG